MTDKVNLAGKIVCWCGLEPCEHQPGRAPGHGEILGLVTDQQLLVRVLAEPDDDEPPHMRVFAIDGPSLLFFPDEAAWRRWEAWLEGLDKDPKPQNAGSSNRRH